jgi:hypothetical protein
LADYKDLQKRRQKKIEDKGKDRRQGISKKK